MAVTVDPLKTNKPWLGSLSTSLVTVGGGQPRTLADLFNDSVSYKNYVTTGNTFLEALQDGLDDRDDTTDPHAVFIPPGIYDNVDMSKIGAAVMGSNSTIWGIPGTVKIKPDMSTVQVFSSGFGELSRYLITTGVSATRTRAGTITAGAVDPTTIVENVSVFGLDFDNSAYFNAGRVQLAANKFLTAISLWFAHGARIENCYGFGLPNSGFNMASCRDYWMRFNHAERCGYLCGSSGTRNGISTSGWTDALDRKMSADNGHVLFNHSNYNWQEGIQNSSTHVVTIEGNHLIGNHEYGIEGENTNSDSSKTSATYGYEVPAHGRVVNNYIDGYDPLDGVYGTAGISWNSGNQGNIDVIGNTVRNITNAAGVSPSGLPVGSSLTSGSGMQVAQVNDGIVNVCGNILENITPGNTGQLIAVRGGYVVARDNKAYNCDATSTLVGVFMTTGAKHLDLGGNRHYGTAAIKRYSDITLDAGAGNTCALDFLSFKGAILDNGCTDSAIVIRCPHEVTVKKADFSNMNFDKVNTSASSSAGMVRITGSGSAGVAGAYNLTITDCIMDNVVCDFGGTTSFPIIFDATTVVNDGCIVNLHAYNHRYTGTLTNSTLYNTSSAAKVTNRYVDKIGFPGFPNVVVKTTSGSVTMVDENEAVIVNKATGAATIVKLPGNCTVGRPRVISDGKGDAGTNNITIQLPDGVTTYDIIDQNKGARTLIPLTKDGTSWITVA